MRLLLIVSLAACSGASHGPVDQTGKGVDSEEGAWEQPVEYDQDHDALVLGEPILHEDELPEGCAIGQPGDDLLVVVNKEAGQNLRCDWQPSDLKRLSRRYIVPRRTSRERGAKLRAPAADALALMMENAREEGVSFYVRSAYRSYSEQARLFKHKIAEHGLEHAKRFSAEAGRSQHQLGTAVDLTSQALHWRIEEDFADTRAGTWLADNAYRFGFALSYPEDHEELTGYAFEPWHYRYIGERAA